MTDFRFQTYIGAEISTIIPALAELRFTVFREFPYLYAGNIDYEFSYLNRYTLAPNAFVFAIFKGDELIGASTALPMLEEQEGIKNHFPLSEHASLMYFGESILLPAYRGLGFGKRFFKEREAYAFSFPAITTCVFCSVTRGNDHPLRPVNYTDHSVFWGKQGYLERRDNQIEMKWLDIDQTTETTKKLVFWEKSR